MALEILDTEFVIWAPTLVDLGGNPIPDGALPPGGSIVYSTDHPEIAQLSFDARTASDGTEYPALAADGSQGTYVGSGGLGTAGLTATPTNLPPSFVPQSDSITMKQTVAGSMNMTFGIPKAE